MARRFTLFRSLEVRSIDDLDVAAASWPDGFMPGTVAPFVMRYGTDFLVAMQRAAASEDATRSPNETEPEPA
jgi:hypothetical protein